MARTRAKWRKWPMESEQQAFVDAICTDPTDDVARLIYADWLEEHDEEERAHFIRDHITSLQNGVLRTLTYPDGIESDVEWMRHDMRYMRGHAPWRLTYERGFVTHIGVELQQFQRLVEDHWIFRRYPITRVHLIDRRPVNEHPGLTPTTVRQVFGRTGWIRDDRSYYSDEIPSRLFGHLLFYGFRDNDRAVYDDTEKALADLAQACIAWGRQSCLLPPIELKASTV